MHRKFARYLRIHCEYIWSGAQNCICNRRHFDLSTPNKTTHWNRSSNTEVFQTPRPPTSGSVEWLVHALKSLVSDCWLYLLYHTTCSKYLKIWQTVASNGATQRSCYLFWWGLILFFSNWRSRILRHFCSSFFHHPPSLSPNMNYFCFTLHPEMWSVAWVAKSPVCHEVSRTWQKAVKV